MKIDKDLSLSSFAYGLVPRGSLAPLRFLFDYNHPHCCAIERGTATKDMPWRAKAYVIDVASRLSVIGATPPYY
jgi:hypothetical protein